MSVQKNFVVKNGLEVKNNLIFTDTTSNSVGIGTTQVEYKLHVLGGIGATDLYVSGVVTASLYYGDGSSLSGIASIGGDATYNDVIVGGGLSVTGISTFGSNIVVGGGLSVTDSSTFMSEVTINSGLSVTGISTFDSNIIVGGGLSVTGISTFASDVDINASLDIQNDIIVGGGLSVTGIITASSFVKSGGTSSQFLKADGSVDSNTYLQNVVEDTTPQLGGNLDLNSKDVTGTGNLNVTGIVTASTFKGSAQVGISSNSIYLGLATQFNFVGSGITITPNYDATSGITTLTFISSTGGGVPGGSDGQIQYNNAGSFGGVSGFTYNGTDLNFTGIITASSFVKSGGTSSQFLKADGTVDSSTYLTSALQNVVEDTTPQLGGNLDLNSKSITGTGNLNVTGIITASQGFNIGIQSGGVDVTTGVITAINFIGAGNTIVYNAGTKTVDVSIEGGGGGGSSGSSYQFNVGITSIASSQLLGIGNIVLTIPSTSGKRYIIHSINASNIAIGNTEVNVIGAFDFSGGERSYFAYNVPIPTGTSVELLRQPQVLNPSDVIVMRGTDYDRNGSDDAVQVYISYEVKDDTNYFGVGIGTIGIASTNPIGIYTSTTYPSVIQSIRLANRTDTGGYPVSVTVTSGVTTTYLIDDLIVPKYSSVEILDTPKAIKTNDIIQVIVDQTETIDVQVSGIKIV